MTSLPWPSENSQISNAIRDRNFLKRAKEQLDADHYGLDKIKRRLIEFLAVIRLHQLAADAEQKAKEDRTKEVSEAQSNALVVQQTDAGKAVNTQLHSESSASKRSKNTVKGPILL